MYHDYTNRLIETPYLLQQVTKIRRCETAERRHRLNVSPAGPNAWRNLNYDIENHLLAAELGLETPDEAAKAIDIIRHSGKDPAEVVVEPVKEDAESPDDAHDHPPADSVEPDPFDGKDINDPAQVFPDYDAQDLHL